MAKPKSRDIEIQWNGKFNTNGTVHETIGKTYVYWNIKLPNNTATYAVFPNDFLLGSCIQGECKMSEYAK